ncbi:MAG: complex I subunit 1/NuoH family protein [Limisphaerales bacterium]
MDWEPYINHAIKIIVVFGVAMTGCAYGVLLERKVSAVIQDRVGPNRVAFPTPLFAALPIIGPFVAKLAYLLFGWWLSPIAKRYGLVQPLVDGAKSFIKEDYTPQHVRPIYYWMAPMVAMLPAILVLAVIPFGSTLKEHKMVIADLDVGILFTFGIVSLSVYGVVLAGYAANSKYPFLGGIRSSAQMISYEIAMGMSVVPVFMLVGNLNFSKVIEYQAKNGWLIYPEGLGLVDLFIGVGLFLSFIIFFVSVLAETNRIPFDLPEAETELVAGYNTEYGSMRFAMFFIGEYIAMIAGSALVVILFLGGWSVPFLWTEPASDVGTGIGHILAFLLKTGFVFFVIVWIRWMLPRFRYDQLMDLGWRRILPLALANIVWTAGWMAYKYGKFGEVTAP